MDVNINDLPPEIIAHISRFLDWKRCLEMRGVNRHCRNALTIETCFRDKPVILASLSQQFFV